MNAAVIRLAKRRERSSVKFTKRNDETQTERTA